jgi:hypothetical protein
MTRVVERRPMFTMIGPDRQPSVRTPASLRITSIEIEVLRTSNVDKKGPGSPPDTMTPGMACNITPSGHSQLSQSPIPSHSTRKSASPLRHERRVEHIGNESL